MCAAVPKEVSTRPAKILLITAYYQNNHAKYDHDNALGIVKRRSVACPTGRTGRGFQISRSFDDQSAPDARDIIFSNLEPLNGELYYSDPYYSFDLAGKTANGTTETWAAIAFTPKVDVQAKVLLAAITYISGAKTVNLGIYSNNDNTGSVGTVLPGGQGSTHANSRFRELLPVRESHSSWLWRHTHGRHKVLAGGWAR